MYHNRFLDLEWYEKEGRDIIIGGVGGIGSWLAFFLGRIGHRLYIFDFDIVEPSNLGGQLYSKEHFNQDKTRSCASIIKSFSDNSNVFPMGKYKEESLTNSIVFSAFDNMKSRKLMFEKWAKSNTGVFIDGRMQAEYFEVYIVTPDRIEQYQETLFDDSEVPDLPCSMKATSHCGAMCAGHMVSALNNWITNQNYKNLRELPFKISLDLTLFMYDLTDSSVVCTN